MQYRVVFLLARSALEQPVIPMREYIGVPAKSKGHAESSRADDSVVNGSCLSQPSNTRLVTGMSARDGLATLDQRWTGQTRETQPNACHLWQGHLTSRLD
jgi:hypothetical protein